ncbi:MAG: tRNA (adenosine(37)-N6)-threonylcarbamoyltransferase complex dimerization subunit type 1 TsaB [Bacilli bacterium]|nr:tRNA (adenosine(37)-N6)-threonylcarbamoyltransferase complex dimerization subunit type 1 TsaB [Bacilli bacterium]
MKILFIDTSLSNLVIGLVEDNKILSSKFVVLNNDLSINTIPYINDLFNEVNVLPEQIDKIMVVNGPGSFTGIRIGVTIAKVMAWSLNKKIIPVSSLKAMALSVRNHDYIISLIDARRDCYYAGIYDKSNNNIMEEQYISGEELLNKINNLNGSKILVSNKSFLLGNQEVAAVTLDILNIVNYNNNQAAVNPHHLNPNYLKKTEAENKLGS